MPRESAAGVNYTYDGDGNRLQKSSGKIYWYGAGTEILDESDAGGNFTNEYVFFGGERIAMRNVSTGAIYYYAEDMLGSSRTMVQDGQSSPCFDADYTPYGGERDIVNTCAPVYKFGGKERDTETGNDDFGARYYSFRFGRWLSADWSSVPAPVPCANLTNPQTLNLYAMVSDNPETFADLDGHCPPGDPCADSNSSPAGTTTASSATADAHPLQKDPTALPQAEQASAAAPAILGAASTLSSDALIAASVAARVVGVVAAAADFLLAAPATASSSSDTISGYNQAHGSPGPAAATGAAIGSIALKEGSGSGQNTNPYAGPVSRPVTVVDPKGNAIPVGKGQQLQGSKDGRWTQVKDGNGHPTSTRVDGGHPGHADPGHRLRTHTFPALPIPMARHGFR